jgi:hypothetical protein
MNWMNEQLGWSRFEALLWQGAIVLVSIGTGMAIALAIIVH